MSLTGIDPRNGRTAAQVATAIDTAVGLQDWIETPAYRFGAPAAAALVAGTLYVARIYPTKDGTITSVTWLNGSTVTGNAEVVVLTYDGTTWTRVGTTGAVVQAGVSLIQTVTGLSIPIFRANRTYLGLIPSAAGAYARSLATVADQNAISATGILAGLKAAVNIPCPATVTAIAADIRCIWLAATLT